MASSSIKWGGSVSRSTLSLELFDGRSPRAFWFRVLWIAQFGRGNRGILANLRLRDMAYAARLSLLARILSGRLERRFSCYISPKARIGAGLAMPHPVGIVVGEGVVLGERCTLYQQVTLGGRAIGARAAGAYPKIEDGVTIYAGAKIVGDIVVGAGAAIGANAVVIKTVPPGSIAVGVPARILPTS